MQVLPSPANFASKMCASMQIFMCRSQRLCHTVIHIKMAATRPFQEGCYKFESTGEKIFKSNFLSHKPVLCSWTNVNISRKSQRISFRRHLRVVPECFFNASFTTVEKQAIPCGLGKKTFLLNEAFTRPYCVQHLSEK